MIVATCMAHPKAASAMPVDTHVGSGEFVAEIARIEADIAGVRAEIDIIERLRLTGLQRELARLNDDYTHRTRAAAAADFRTEAAKMTREVSALRRSWSWKITSPLRAVIELFRAGRSER